MPNQRPEAVQTAMDKIQWAGISTQDDKGNWNFVSLHCLVDYIATLEADNARKNEALEFYVNPTEELRDKYGVGMPNFYSETAFADVAIAALAKEGE